MTPASILSLLVLLVLPISPASAGPAEHAAGTSMDECWQEPVLRGAQVNADPLPVGALVPCPGIRPGARVYNEIPGGATSACTLNFVFRGTSYDEEGKPVDEGLFIGTAGHCYLEEPGERTWAPGMGPVAEDADRRRFGEYAYAVELGAEPWDFALIRIDDDREAEVSPRVCHFGGPTGISGRADLQEGDIVHHFGQGFLYSDTVQGRSGVSITGPELTFNSVWFIGSVLPGDSGGPLIDADGDALGVVTNFLPPTVMAQFLGQQVDRAAEKLDMDLDMIEAPLAA